MASGYESLTPMELRKKLLEYGYDLPVSVKKEFMIKMLEKAVGDGKRKVTRQSLPPSVPSLPSNNNNRYETESNASSHSRKSTGSRASRASMPASVGRREAPIAPLQSRSAANASPIVEDFEEAEDFEDDQELYTQEDDSQESNRPSISSSPPRRLQEPKEEEEDEDEENEENRTPSPRYESYINYFKSNSRADPFVMPRSQYSSPAGSPFSTVANVGSPSFRQRTFDLDDSADESENDVQQVRRRGVGVLNPRNWVPSFSWFRKGSRGQDQKQNEEVNFNFGSGSSGREQASFNFGSASAAGPSRMAAAGSAGTNGHFGSQSARLANQIYSPAPPPVNPGIAAGRQAGFKAFFSRGERNGINYGNNGPRESSMLIPKLLVVGFVVMLLGVLGTYYYITAHGNGNTGALPMADEIEQFFDAKGGPIADPPVQNSPPPEKKSVPVTTLVYPVCGAPEYDEPLCIPREKLKQVQNLFDTLMRELTQRTKDKFCGSDVQDKISLNKARSLLFDLTQSALDDDTFDELLMLIIENPVMNMKLDRGDENDVKLQDVESLDHESAMVYVHGVSPFLCSLMAVFYLVFNYTVYFLSGAILMYTSFRVWKWLKQKKATEDEEVFATIDKIVDLLQHHYEETKNTENNKCLAVNHIRDMMFGPRERKQKEKLWKRVVEEIKTNDSRIREEIQHISGEEFPVWRWLPSTSPLSSRMSMGSASPSPVGPAGDASMRSPKLYPNLSGMATRMGPGEESGSFLGSPGGSRWQGQAFEMFDGSPNSLQQPPSTCLKIRQMFANARDLAGHKIEQSILEKCANSKVLHIGIDRTNREGAVYIRCFSKGDAANAYREMHGWWYEGHLLSVKFLREERYFTRFPEAQQRTIPLTVANFNMPLQSFGSPQPVSVGR